VDPVNADHGEAEWPKNWRASGFRSCQLGLGLAIVSIAVALGAAWSFRPRSDEQLVHEAYREVLASHRARDAARLLQVLTPESVDMLSRRIDAALYASEGELEAMGPMEFWAIVQLRANIDIATLRSMDPEKLVAWYFEAGHWSADIDRSLVPLDPIVTGDTADMGLGYLDDIKWTLKPWKWRRSVQPLNGFTYRFVQVESRWRLDIVTELARIDGRTKDWKASKCWRLQALRPDEESRLALLAPLAERESSGSAAGGSKPSR
jgi:hypothetical protein